MVFLKILMEIALPKMGELLVMRMTMISPSGREVPTAESLHRRAKVLLPKFRLEMAALHPESHLLIFSRSKWPIYQKMGTECGSMWAQPTRARPSGLCPPGGPPLVVICSNILQIFHNKSPWSFSLFGVVQNRWPDLAFPGLELYLPIFSLFV